MLRPEILDDLLIGFGGLRDRRPEPVEYTLDREFLHRVCQMGSATQGESHVQPHCPSLRPAPVRLSTKITVEDSKIELVVLLSLSRLGLIRGNPMTCSLPFGAIDFRR